MPNILTTGGSGFIGSHTCLVLLNAGFDVVILDSFFNSSEKVINKLSKLSKINNSDISQRLKVYKGDIRDSEILNLIFREAEAENNPISSVIHFAALKAVSESNDIPLNYWDVNVCGTINILK